MKAVLIAVASLWAAFAVGDSAWTLNSADPTWWFTESAWSSYPPSGNVTLSPSVNSGRSYICLKDGDAVSVGGVTTSASGKSYGLMHFQIQKGAKFTFTGAMTAAVNYSTNIIDVAGGTMRGNSFQPGPGLQAKDYVYVTNRADVAVASMDLGRLGPVDLYVEDSTFLVTNGNPTVGRADGSFVSRWFGKNAVFGPKSITVRQYGQLLLEDSVLDGGFNAQYVGGVIRLTNTVVTASSIVLGNKNYTPGDAVELELVGEETSVGTLTQLALYNNVKYVQRGGKVEIVRNANDLNALSAEVTSGFTAEQHFEVHGGTFSLTNLQANGGAMIQLAGAGRRSFKQDGGTVSSYGVCFNVSGTETPRYEMRGGTFCARGYVFNQTTVGGIMDAADTVSKSGVFSIFGGLPEVRLQRIGSYNKTARQPQIDFVICTNGCPTIYMDAAPASLCNWVNGYFTIRPQGGVQLMHTDKVTLLDATASKRNLSCQNLNKGGTLLPNASLWVPGATTTTRSIDVMLKPEAEIALNETLSEGRSCGWVSLPKVKKETCRELKLLLKLEPQGAETLDSLAAGFSEAGFAAKKQTGADYNMSLKIPLSLIVDRSETEKILIDFNEYADAEAVRDASPTVRARVTRVGLVKVGAGLIIHVR